MLQEPVQELPPSVAFAITYVSKSFIEVQMATSSSRVFSTKRECLDQNSLELSSSANSSASLLAQVNFLLPDAVESMLRMQWRTKQPRT